ncbi:MAG: superoxide dismutase [Desulfuromonadales bacterium C00003068]|jgi:nickel superoxide dismutase|nr:superoxide dismutase [Deltaproteobacteria bacterium]OEU71032.1 MAG: superoxide dismutase [Desulfuromonadales bacterium C00003068]
MKRIGVNLVLVGFMTVLFATTVLAHCEVPCGIYDDQARIDMLLEHATTIEKSMNQIMEIEKAGHGHSNQLVRWIMNKEKHATLLQGIVTQYFMTQRIKAGADHYDAKLKALHGMLVQAMKCKQTVDLAHVAKLRALVVEFAGLYFVKK